MAHLDIRYTQVGFNFTTVQVCFPNLALNVFALRSVISQIIAEHLRINWCFWEGGGRGWGVKSIAYMSSILFLFIVVQFLIWSLFCRGFNIVFFLYSANNWWTFFLKFFKYLSGKADWFLRLLMPLWSFSHIAVFYLCPRSEKICLSGLLVNVSNSCVCFCVSINS